MICESITMGIVGKLTLEHVICADIRLHVALTKAPYVITFVGTCGEF